jgi:signal peptidase I
MNWKWFVSGTVRQATHACNHVAKIVNHQRDLLAVPALEAVNAEIAAVRALCAKGTDVQVREGVAKLETAANRWLKPYPNAAWRENIEVMLVAIAVAMGIRTFVLQPFKIPTGSMQPTLYGVTDENLIGRTDFKMPNPVAAFLEYWFAGVSYKHVVAKGPGQLVAASEPTKLVLFNLKQSFRVGDHSYSIWFPPDNLLQRAGLIDENGLLTQRTFAPGSDIIKMRIVSGDHLFVDRVSYNFRRPKRGDVVVFETHGITALPASQQDTYYIKRLVSTGGETLSLKQDFTVTGVPARRGSVSLPVGHLVADGKDLSAQTPRFEHLYSFADAPRRSTTMPFRENHYHGHGLLGDLVPGASVQIPTNHYFVLGDNTFNSSDGRNWGTFPRERVIGKSFFVYWPIGRTTFRGEERPSRFGWGHQ